MTDTKTIAVHPTDIELADFLDNRLSPGDRKRVESHLARCDECLGKTVSAYDSVRIFRNKRFVKKVGGIMKRINIYLTLAIISFALSFVTSRYFLQLLVATLLLGAKWIVDSKSTKMLIMIYEAWKKGGEKEASRILERFDPR
jgi:hypothetical protein